MIAFAGDSALVTVAGMIDERFPGFGDLTGRSTVVIDVSGVTFMTSFGVRQWLIAMGALPRTLTDLYLLGCPTIMVDQLNMILNFGGSAKIVTLVAPYACPACGAETLETVDVVADGAHIAQGEIPERPCPRCGKPLVFDEIPESYFACLRKYRATHLSPAAAQLIAQRAQLRTTVVAPAAPRVPSAAAQAALAREGSGTTIDRSSSSLGMILVVVVLLALVAGIYFLVGPS